MKRLKIKTFQKHLNMANIGIFYTARFQRKIVPGLLGYHAFLLIIGIQMYLEVPTLIYKLCMDLIFHSISWERVNKDS